MVEGGSIIGVSPDVSATSGFRKCPVQKPEHFAHCVLPHGRSGSGIGKGTVLISGPPGNQHIAISSFLALQRGCGQTSLKQHTSRYRYCEGKHRTSCLCRISHMHLLEVCVQFWLLTLELAFAFIASFKEHS